MKSLRKHFPAQGASSRRLSIEKRQCRRILVIESLPEGAPMSLWRPDPTFYPSPKMAMAAPPEKLAYVAMLNANGHHRPAALGVVDVDPASSGYGHFVGQLDMPNTDHELHHSGWNACSASLCPDPPHPHIERRYLFVP